MNTMKVRITNGLYGQKPINGIYTAMGPWKVGSKGGFIPVLGSELGAAGFTARVIVDKENIQIIEGGDVNGNIYDTPSNISFHEVINNDNVTHTPESDEESLNRMRQMFEILSEMTYAVIDGHVKGMIVYGPPGVGKSYNVITALNEASFNDILADGEGRHKVYHGYMSPVHLFRALYESREADNIVVFDDCDSVLMDPDSLNILKAALDTTSERWLNWNSESRMLKEEEIPNRFEFKGGIIFITNVDFENYRGKIKESLEAIVSRCHYLDLTIDTKRDKFLWLREVTLNKGMLSKKGLTTEQSQEIIDFVDENVDRMRELSLRMILKLADLRKVEGNYNWRHRAEVTCMKRTPGRSSRPLATMSIDNNLTEIED